MRTLLGLLTAGLLMTTIIGCNRDKSSASARPRIALVLKTLNNPYFIDMEGGARDAASRLGIDLTVQAAEREIDVEKQLDIIENLIQSNVAALLVTPSGSKEIVPAIVKANTARIPVFILDTRVNPEALEAAGGKIAGFIGSDNVEGGKIAGDYIVKRLDGKGRVAILEGIAGHETGDSRVKGFRQAIANYPGIEVVSSQTANWERDQGYNVFQNILQSHPDVQALFACSDLMALGATEAIAAAGKTGKIVVVGFDAFSEARDAVLKGTMDATVAQSPFDMGRIAVENAHNLLAGQPVDSEVTIKVKLITKDNAREE
jgi:ribose transport system substrate-binding protein